jgi:hypothetical protein
MKAKMAATSAHMRQFNGPERAAGLLDKLLKDHARWRMRDFHPRRHM